MLPAIITLVITLVSIIAYLSQRKHNYWKKKKVPFIKPVPLFGNYARYILQKATIGEVTQEICTTFPNEPIIGGYYGTEPVLIPQDPEFIKLITTKDFFYFNGREVSDYCDKEVTTRNMFFTHGDNWKVMRQNFAPLFTTAKMKSMFHLIVNCANALDTLIEEDIKSTNEFEVKLLMSRYTLDCIGSAVFGVESNVMGTEVENNPFKRVSGMTSEVSFKRLLNLTVRAIWPSIFYGLKLRVFPAEMHEFLSKVLFSVIKERNNKPSPKHDFVDLIMSLRSNTYMTGTRIAKPKEKDGDKISVKLDDDLIAAQCIVLFTAGFETSAMTMAMTLFELAKNAEHQAKVHAEVDAYLSAHAGIDYECVNELPFVEQCIDEALRLYPVLMVITRDVREDYKLPSGVVIERGMRVHLPVYHIHRNPKYFPEPDRFKPERFGPEERHKIIPYTYFPFGEGPRICIGRKFARMQMMAGLIKVLGKYRIELAEGMPRKLELEPRSLVTQTKDGIRLKFIRR